MKEITYSQDIVINDKDLLATLSIFCKKIYLPYPYVANDVYASALQVDHPQKDEFLKHLEQLRENDPERDLSFRFRDNHPILFGNNIIEFLPVHRYKDHKHRHIDDTEEVENEMYGNLDHRGVSTKVILRHHIIRDDLPGTEFFEGKTQHGEIELARSIFHLELPKISGDDEKIFELRNLAQRKDINEFWERIEEQVEYADASNENYMARSEKIRKDFTKWTGENLKFRARGLVVGGLIGLCFVNLHFVKPAAVVGAEWIGEANRRWIERKSLRTESFKFMSRIHGKIKKMSK